MKATLARLSRFKAWAGRTFLQPRSVTVLHIPGDVVLQATHEASALAHGQFARLGESQQAG